MNSYIYIDIYTYNPHTFGHVFRRGRGRSAVAYEAIMAVAPWKIALQLLEEMDVPWSGMMNMTYCTYNIKYIYIYIHLYT